MKCGLFVRLQPFNEKCILVYCYNDSKRTFVALVLSMQSIVDVNCIEKYIFQLCHSCVGAVFLYATYGKHYLCCTFYIAHIGRE